MKIFISWSGTKGKKIGKCLHDWFPKIIQSLVPFYSEEDIKTGSIWVSTLHNELQKSAAGIICLTNENCKEPWIMFESGALLLFQKSGGENLRPVCPILFGIDSTEIAEPLTQLNYAKFDKEKMLKLIKDLNSANLEKISDQVIEDTFEKFWPDLETDVREILASTTSDSVPLVKTEKQLLSELIELVRKIDRKTPEPFTLNLPTGYAISNWPGLGGSGSPSPVD